MYMNNKYKLKQRLAVTQIYSHGKRLSAIRSVGCCYIKFGGTTAVQNHDVQHSYTLSDHAVCIVQLHVVSSPQTRMHHLLREFGDVCPPKDQITGQRLRAAAA